MPNTLLINVSINDELIYITNLYCNYVNYLVDLFKPVDEEMFNLFVNSYSKTKPKLNYIFKPLRQNAQLPKQFLCLAERRSLSLLRCFCKKIKKMIVKSNGEVRDLLFKVPPLNYKNEIDLNDRVSKINERTMQIFFNNQVINLKLESDPPYGGKAIYLNISRKKVLFLVPSIRFANGTQLGERLNTPSPQLD